MTTCDLCDKPAIYHDVRIVNGVHDTTHLCADHAIQSGINLGPVDLSIVLNISESQPQQGSGNSCADCGMTISQYKNTSLLGCPTCYETFNEELASIIANVQDNHTQHIGRAPSQSNMNLDRHLQIRRLLKQLESAVNQEEYEHAAELRDKLRELHNAGESHEN